MIIDLSRFVKEGRPYWSELEQLLDRLETDPKRRLDMIAVRRFHYLYQRASADLTRLSTFAHDPEVRRYLESLVARAYGEIHEVRGRPHRLSLIHWFTTEFPRAFRRRIKAFWLSVAITLLGCLFGAGALAFDYESRRTLYPGQFGHLMERPSERVAREEQQAASQSGPMRGTFAAFLMKNNISVSIRAMAFGFLWGIGTIILLFYNGVIMGAVALDYVSDGQTRFLLGWLLPHGSIEIPAVVLAGQAGIVLASAVIGWGDRHPLRARLRAVAPDLVRLIYGVAILLVWAGIIESFMSQYHEPVLPYSVKIAFGVTELLLLTLFLALSGREKRGAGRKPETGAVGAPA